MNNSKKAARIYLQKCFFSSFVRKKIDGKHFLVYIKVKKKLTDIDKCVLETFLKLWKFKCLNRKTPFFISAGIQTTRKHLR